MLSLSSPALEQLAALLHERAGLKIAADGFHGLRLALMDRMPALGISDAEDYVRRLRELAGETELRALLPLVTVSHTEFFRDPRQFKALETRVLPAALTRARAERRTVRIWSAGCATGEEPYSLAMVLCELGARPEEVELWATDLNPAAVDAARAGRYSARRLAGMSAERLQRFFRLRPEGGGEVLDALKQYVKFDGQNLAAPVFARVQPGTFDVVLCRNVIIYFDVPTIRGLMDRFYAALRRTGLLVLGYSESLFRVYERFEMVEVEGAFLYRRPENDLAPRRPPLPAAPPLPPPAAPARERLASLRKSVAQTQAEAQKPGATSGAEIAPVSSAPQALPERQDDPLAEVVRRIEQGAFDAARIELERLLRKDPSSLPVLLTLANVNALTGNTHAAHGLFKRALELEPLCLEARVFGALAAMQASDFPRAREEISRALFLDPALALAHYLSAQVRERLGEHDAARRAYRNAIAQAAQPQRPLLGYFPDLPESTDHIARASRYALVALEEAC